MSESMCLVQQAVRIRPTRLPIELLVGLDVVDEARSPLVAVDSVAGLHADVRARVSACHSRLAGSVHPLKVLAHLPGAKVGSPQATSVPALGESS